MACSSVAFTGTIYESYPSQFMSSFSVATMAPGVVTCRSRVSKVVFEATVNGKPITVFHVGKFETINMALI